jgi:hypothetical protein
VSRPPRPLIGLALVALKGETIGEGFKDLGTWHAARQAAQ